MFIGLALAAGSCGGGGGERGGVLENEAIVWSWHLADGKFRPSRVEGKLDKAALDLTGECFQLELDGGVILKTSDFNLDGLPEESPLVPELGSPALTHHLPGRQLVVRFSNTNRNLSAEWRAILGDGAAYVREELSLHALNKDVLLSKIVLLDETVSGARTVGLIDGSPVVGNGFYFGYEHPMARNTVSDDARVQCSFARNAILKAGESLTQSCVIGVVPAGQLRRGFLRYIERERAHPYRPFLHYNSWFDISWNTRKYNESECLAVIHEIGQQLVQQRGVQLSAFLFDDGWDDNRTLWKFHGGFPEGFSALAGTAAKSGAGIGVWLSPFGGYHDAKKQRLEYGGEQGFETNAYGFSLAGPKYYQRFRDICLEMVQNYGANAFKFDGLAAGARASESGLTRDGDAMMRLVADLRGAKPNLYISQTTGTWPSPFWLLYVDSTWRGGDDHQFLGKGSWCQRWMTYRDAQTYRNVVLRAPLYPLNSLMLHGLIYATNASHLDSMNDADFADQAREFFGTGTQLQEMYITPGLLNRQNWDALAEAANWSRTNADVLVDTHWIGGDPAKGEVYGWASWCPRKGILTLRNPDEQPAAFTADIGEMFQLPPEAAMAFRLRSLWKKESREAEVRVGQPHRFNLNAFEVLVLETR
jgi:hypothetical protein